METTGKLENEQLLSWCRFVQNIAPPSLSRNMRIKMEQNKQINVLLTTFYCRLCYWYSSHQLLELVA